MKNRIVFLVVLVSQFCWSQEEKETSEVFTKHHSIGFMLSHTNISQGVKEDGKRWLSVPSFVFDYNYIFSEKWSVGLHNDLIVENLKIENDKEEVLERTSPFASVIVVGFKPEKHFTFELGNGGEFAKEENFFLTRLGVEYSLEIKNDWELISNIVYDIKWNAYDSFSFGIGIAKSFGK